MKPIPTLIWYYYICQRQVWLMARQIGPDQIHPFIEIGRLISKESYYRERKEIHLENMIIDLLKEKDKEIVIGEVKKSSKYEKAAKMQLAYYLLRLREFGICARGELLFPKEKKKIRVELTREVEEELNEVETKIKQIILMNFPPPPVKIRFCKNCGYREFCWA